MYDKVVTIQSFICGVPSSSKSMGADTDVDRFNYAFKHSPILLFKRYIIPIMYIFKLELYLLYIYINTINIELPYNVPVVPTKMF